MVEDDGAVGPAVVVDQTQVGEDPHADGLQAPLVAQREAVAPDLQAGGGGGSGHGEGRTSGLDCRVVIGQMFTLTMPKMREIS